MNRHFATFRIRNAAFALSAAAIVFATASSEARVTSITITQTQSPAFGGQVFGSAGQFEIIRGVARGEIDPASPLNAIITDINLAPRNARGYVEYETTFAMAKPIDMAKASGVLFYSASNRGGGNPVAAADGNVYMLSGWQGDLAANAVNRATVPIARNPDGSSITGVVLARIAEFPAGTNTQTLQVLGRAIPYDAVMDKSQARLIRKDSETRTGINGPTVEIPAGDWAFADCRTVPFPGTPDPRRLCLKNGFDPTKLYEMVYIVKDPTVLGVGLAAWRDVVSFFRYSGADDNRTPNPIAGRITHAIGQGISQSGNGLKTFLLLGFNEDEAGRIIFEGMNAHIAGRLTAINVRFGLPSGSGTLYEPGGEGVLWWHKFPDHVRRDREPAGLLDRCNKSNTCPQIFETFGATEFNARLMSIALTGTSGANDIPVPKNVRRYYFPGTTHGGGNGGFRHSPVAAAGCTLANNANPENETMDALLVALQDWVVKDVTPPESVYPTLVKKTMARANAKAIGFPSIPGVPLLDGQAIGLMEYDFGPQFHYNDFSGVISQQPPGILQIIPPFLPKVNADGNEGVGVASVLHQAPLGTYTGWNPTAQGFFIGQPCGGGLVGGYIPFKATKAERIASGDPRLSLEERYGTQRGYLCVVNKAAEQEVAKRFLLPADAASLVARAQTDVATFNFLPVVTGDPAANAVADKLCAP